MPVRANILLQFCAILAAWPLPGCYVLRQAIHQNGLYNTRRSVDEVIEDGSTTLETREKLQRVQDVIQFAVDQGLNGKGAYRTFIQTKSNVVSYLVQAAPPDRMELETWWFPIVGSVPYLGYFEKSDRDQKASELRAEGFDVSLSGVGAFSSLGWFEDAIFSSMIKRDTADLAHLFFHELTHRTLWVKGSVEFNENLAEFIGLRLTRKYLEKNGESDLLVAFEEKLGDRRLFRDWLVALSTELRKAFDEPGKSRSEKLAAKKAIIDRFLATPSRPAFKRVDFVSNAEWNNASILGSSLYAPDFSRFERAFRCSGSTSERDFLEAMDKKLQSDRQKVEGDGGFKVLDSFCEPAVGLVPRATGTFIPLAVQHVD